MSRLKATNQDGFTLIELLLAMTLFTLTMMIATVGFIGMNRSFTQGTVKRQLSESVQKSTDAVSRIVRSDGRALDAYRECASTGSDPLCPPNASTWKGALCFNTARFIWNDSSMYLQPNTACDAAIASMSGEEILNNRFKVEYLQVATVTNQPGLFSVTGVFRTLEDQAFNNPTATDKKTITCKGSASGFAQTCAVEVFSTIINARGGEV